MKNSSTLIQSYSFSEAGLTINFTSGKTYIYPDATEKMFDEMQELEKDGKSLGKYFNEKVKMLKFKRI